MSKKSQANGFAIGEIVFILLPFIVMTIIYVYENKLITILKEPEWSLASSVMFGQSIIKIIHCMTRNSFMEKKTIYEYNLGAALAIFIVLGLVPSLIVLSLIFISNNTPEWLIVFQIILFITALIVFTTINRLQVQLEEEVEEKTKKQID